MQPKPVVRHLLRLILMVTLLQLQMLTIDRPSCEARMEQMADGELDAVTGAGFSSFTFQNGIALADFTGISASTYAEINALNLGYWDKGGGKGWDQSWNGVKLGTAANDLVFKGFYIKAVFDPATVNDPANRTLLSVTIGSRDVTGTMSANFQSITGMVGGVSVDRGALGNASYQFNHGEFSVSVDMAGPNKGVWVNMGTATRL